MYDDSQVQMLIYDLKNFNIKNKNLNYFSLSHRLFNSVGLFRVKLLGLRCSSVVELLVQTQCSKVRITPNPRAAPALGWATKLKILDF